MMNRKINLKSRGTERWIRLRGTPDDPESFDYAIWDGIAWNLTVITVDGRNLTLSIPDYMVTEILPPTSDPQLLYYPLEKAA